MYNRIQRQRQAKNRFGKQKSDVKQSVSNHILPASQDNQCTPSYSDSLRFIARHLLLSCRHVLDAIGPLRLIDGELLVTCDNGAVERIKPTQSFLFLTHRGNDEFVSAARQYLEGCGLETADIVEQANHAHHTIFRQLGGA
jgi:hypothetical protein